MGNRIARGASAGQKRLSYGKMNELLSDGPVTYRYDADGQPVSRSDGFAYEFDGLGRLTGVKAPGKVIRYEYDPFGRLAAREVNGSEDGIPLRQGRHHRRIRGHGPPGKVRPRAGHRRAPVLLAGREAERSAHGPERHGPQGLRGRRPARRGIRTEPIRGDRAARGRAAQPPAFQRP